MRTSLLCLLLALLCTGCERTPGNTESPASPGLAPQTVASLDAALANAGAVREIKRLQYAFAHYLNAGRWNEAAALFSEQGAARFGEQALVGRQAIAGHLRQTQGGGEDGLADGRLNEHLILSPVINVDASGERAEGRWRLVSMRGSFGESAEWLGGIYQNVYRREAGRWVIAELDFHPIYGGPYDGGWRNLREETQESVAPIPFHYDMDEAGQPTPTRPPVTAVLAAADEDAAHRLAELDRRAQRLLDEDAVLNLQHAYGYYFDRKMWDDLAELFAADGTLEIDQRGLYRGRENIRRALEQFGEQGLRPDEIHDHLQLQTVVSVAGDGAGARAQGTELRMTGVHGGSAWWGLASFDNRFVKADGKWRIDDLRVTTRMLTDYDQGWAQSALPAPKAPPGFAPDEASADYPVYPSGQETAFQYPDPAFAEALEPLAAPAPASDIEQAVAELERKLRVLNAYDGAENVANAYGYSIDEFLWDDMADLFAEDGWKELSYIGSYVGRERVRHSVVSRYGRGGRRANSNTFHQKTQPVITVAEDGRSARIRTRLFQFNSSRSNPGSWISGIYENSVVLENGIWKIQGMDLDYAWLADYQGGWARVEAGSSNRFAPAPGSLQGEAAPDRPLRGVIFAPYPLEPVDMAFHYRNPVSGRQPPIFLPDVRYDQLGEE